CSVETVGVRVEFDGQPSLVVTVRDLTQRKEAEEKLRRALAARDRVLGIVAHDLRNPLTTIITMLSAPEPHALGRERRNQRPKEVALRAATRMNHLIKDLLDVALVEAGEFRVLRRSLPVKELIIEALEMQQSLAASSGLELNLDLPEEMPNVFGDHDR